MLPIYQDKKKQKKKAQKNELLNTIKKREKCLKN